MLRDLVIADCAISLATCGGTIQISRQIARSKFMSIILREISAALGPCMIEEVRQVHNKCNDETTSHRPHSCRDMLCGYASGIYVLRITKLEGGGKANHKTVL